MNRIDAFLRSSWPEVARRPLWEFGCLGIDSVLTLSTEPIEVRKVCFIVGSRVPPSVQTGWGHAAVEWAHPLCHKATDFAQEMDRRLAVRHAPALRSFQTLPVDEAVLLCHERPIAGIGDLAGFVWSILSDPRPELRGPDACFLWRLHRNALGALGSRRPGDRECGS